MANAMWRTLKRLVLILALSIVTAAVALFLYGHSCDTRLRRQFGQVTTGMSEEQALSVMGKPYSVGKCGEVGHVPANGCYPEYLYKPLLTISTLAVFFDSKGRVVGKYDYESP